MLITYSIRRLKWIFLIFCIGFVVYLWSTTFWWSFVPVSHSLRRCVQDISGSQSDKNLENQCRNIGPKLRGVIFVHSAPSNFVLRQAIRRSYGSKELGQKMKIPTFFMIGRTQHTPLQDILELEKKANGDIIQFSFVDTYKNLTYKHLRGLQWVISHCSFANFVIKSDDDIIINIFRLSNFLDQIKFNTTVTNRLICRVWEDPLVMRNNTSKWCASEKEYAHMYYPSYCAGAAYIMTMKVAKILHHISKFMPFFWIDDVYVTGILAKKVRLKHHYIENEYSFIDDPDSVLVEREGAIFTHINRDGDSYLKSYMERWKDIVNIETQGFSSNYTELKKGNTLNASLSQEN